MEKIRTIIRRENIERKINKLNKELKQIQNECEHGIIIMYRCSNYYWVDAKCLFCGKKIEDGYVLRKKEICVVNADLESLRNNKNKYDIVKEKYTQISRIHPDWNEQQIVAQINKELRN